MAELWALLISAQENPTGIPDCLLELRKEEITKKRVRIYTIYLLITRIISKSKSTFLHKQSIIKRWLIIFLNLFNCDN